MQISGNTILITGGGSGIGRALAEALQARGNKIIIAGRRHATLDSVMAANPEMRAITVDMTDAGSIAALAGTVVRQHPDLNVVINNAGIMPSEDLTAAPSHLEDAEATISTNLLGPVRLTAALLPHLLEQPRATIMMVSSGLAFVPRADAPSYCATKAAIHSYSLSLRLQLRGTNTEVIELVPPYVQTELQGARQASDPNAMPLADFITEVVTLLGAEPTPPEIVVERCKPLRYAAENGTLATLIEQRNPPGGSR